MLKKILTIYFIYSLLIITIGCRCPVIAFPYYDFHNIAFNYENGDSLTNKDFLISITEIEAENIAQSQNLNWELIASSFALEKCKVNGDFGLKYPITSMDVTSNSNWDFEHPAGTLLNDVIYYSQEKRNSNGEIVGTEYIKLLSDVTYSYHLKFTKPKLEFKHVFTIKLIKSNGSFVKATTNEITWVK